MPYRRGLTIAALMVMLAMPFLLVGKAVASALLMETPAITASQSADMDTDPTAEPMESEALVAMAVADRADEPHRLVRRVPVDDGRDTTDAPTAPPPRSRATL